MERVPHVISKRKKSEIGLLLKNDESDIPLRTIQIKEKNTMTVVEDS